jgi:hypothetical protein
MASKALEKSFGMASKALVKSRVGKHHLEHVQ